MSGPLRPGTEPMRPGLRTTLAASFLLHGALLLVPAGVVLELSGAGAVGEGRGGEAPLVVAFYDPGPLGEEEGPRFGPEAPPPMPEAQEVPPRPATPPAPSAEATPPPSASPAGPGGEEGGGTPSTGEGDPGVRAEGAQGESLFQPPRLLTGALPLDPEEIEDLQVPAEIPVRILVGRTGRVLRIEPVSQDLPEVVEDAIVRSARAMRFVPARRGEEPVEAWFSMTFIYDPGS